MYAIFAIFTFYLNVVGYKVARSTRAVDSAAGFYLNVVGYKAIRTTRGADELTRFI